MAAPRPFQLTPAAALFFAATAVLAVHVSLSSASTVLAMDPDMASSFALAVSSSDSECRGSVAECSVLAGEEEEFLMDSEISRRVLAVTRYISYGALRRNTVPCTRRGVSYYNCRVGAPANPYSRGCSRITRCRG